MKPTIPQILTINGGSSSIKFALFETGNSFRQLLGGAIERIGLPQATLLIEASHRRFPNLPQVACFDTAFHHDLPRIAQLLPIPRRYLAQGVRRCGFHGLSYEFLLGELARLDGTEAASGRVILAHLGSGASLAAVHEGKSIDTSMSLTPTAGVRMSTRSGDIDSGLVWCLALTEQMNAMQSGSKRGQCSYDFSRRWTGQGSCQPHGRGTRDRKVSGPRPHTRPNSVGSETDNEQRQSSTSNDLPRSTW